MSSYRLERIRAALEALSVEQLHGLRFAAQESNAPSPGLFAWLEHAAGWAIDRLNGFDYALRLPLEAVDTDEVPHALLALSALSLTFRQNGPARGIEELFAAAAAAMGAIAPPTLQ